MRASHREVRKRILDRMGKISDKDFFTSKAYQGYLADITESATKRYRRPIRVNLFADDDDPTVAFTDFSGIYINVCNHITQSMPSRELKSISLEGLDGHELGHNLFTDNRIWHAYRVHLASGRFYPAMPAGLDGIHRNYADKILQAMQDQDDLVPKKVIEKTVDAIENILEDGYVDARTSYEFPGRLARGIALNNLRYSELVPDLTEMVHRKYYDHSIVLNLLIQYVRSGEVNNLSGYTGELIDKLLEFVPIVDACIRDDDTRSRCDAVNQIIISLWPIMQRCFDDLRDKRKQQAQQQSSQSQAQQQGQSGASSENQEAGNGSQQPAGEQEEAGEPFTGIQAVTQALSEQLPKAALNTDLRVVPVPCNGAFLPDKEREQELKQQLSRAIAEETARIAAHVTEGIESEGDGVTEYDRQYQGSGYEFSAEDINRLLEDMAEAQVYEALEEELSEDLQREANNISYGNAHKNIHVAVHRMAQVEPDMVDAYNAVAPQLLQLSKRLQRGVSAALRDKRQGGKQTGLYVGKRLDQHALYRNDGRVFCNARLPTEPIDLAVALLVDESGSMAGFDRITRARATAIVVQDFCEKLGIPIMIMGHTASSSYVELYSYAEFDSVDRKDRYRLMDMSPRYCNRDGAALRFVAEKLCKYPAEVKMLFIISDGQPNDDGYGGSAAEADLRGIKLEYSRRGVQIFAAAIGSDREQIERIYGSGYLDITDLNRLPIMLTQLISRNLP